MNYLIDIKTMHTDLLFSLFLIFTGAACLSTAVLFTRQSLLVAYMLLGILTGPSVLGWVTDPALIKQTGDIGIIFLLFLLGLNLHPQKLLHMLRKATLIALLSSFLFGLVGFAIGLLYHFTVMESTIIAAAMMFSSTIIGVKLLPTTMLHHKHIGEVMISILLLQDLLAIAILFFLTTFASSNDGPGHLLFSIVSLPLLLGIAFLVERYVINKLLTRFDSIKEYVFLLTIGWCLGMAQLAVYMGLSAEVGAFVAGVALATSPVAYYISEHLKPLRDFFLVLFFFIIGANFNLSYLPKVIYPALILALLTIFFKPYLFQKLLLYTGESRAVAREVGLRLGQASEFSLLIAYLASVGGFSLIGPTADYLIQAMTLLSFFISSYLVVLRYPTPLALTEKMRKD
ncbi:cation:proton antiporter [soil metagenome]